MAEEQDVYIVGFDKSLRAQSDRACYGNSDTLASVQARKLMGVAIKGPNDFNHLFASERGANRFYEYLLEHQQFFLKTFRIRKFSLQGIVS